MAHRHFTIGEARSEPSPLSGPAAGRQYGIILAVEIASAGAGAAILGITGQAKFISAWVCFVIGVHFLPLARVFSGIGMVGLAIAVVLVAVAALMVGLTTAILPSTVAGMGAGVCLLVHAGSWPGAVFEAPAVPHSRDGGLPGPHRRGPNLSLTT